MAAAGMGRMTSVGITAAAVGALLLVSCSPNKPPVWQDNDQTTVHWVPDPAVDLMSAEGTFVRAATESWAAARSVQGPSGVDAIRHSGYPGFEHAFNNIGKPEKFGGRNDYVTVGTVYNSIVALNRDGERFTAEFCSSLRQTAVLRNDGKYAMNYLADSVSSLSVTFGPDPKIPTSEQHSPPARQKGSAERPTDNVFGTWVMFDYHATYPLNPKCNKFAPEIPHEEMESSLRSDPPPTLPPDPGWPEGSKA